MSDDRLFPFTRKSSWTVQQVQEDWLTPEGIKRLGKGQRCPCCGKNVQVYERKLNRSMAIALRLFDEHLRREKIQEAHCERTFAQFRNPGRWRGDFSKLRFWGLIYRVEKDKNQTGNPRTGFYGITERGRNFLANKVRLPFAYLEYLKQPRAWSDKLVAWSEITVDFDYDRDVRNL